MAGLFLTRTDDPDFAEGALATARAQFALHGFGAPRAIAVPGWQGFHCASIIGGPDSLLIDGDDLVAVAGTLCVDGAFGRPALATLLAQADPLALDWSRIAGQFVALLHRAGRTYLFGDYLGAYQLFHDRGDRLFSTSLLSAAKALPRLRFDAQSVYEHAFNVVPLGDATIFEELRLLGPGTVVELSEGGVRRHRVARPLPEGGDGLTPADRIARHRALLDTVVAPYARHFGDAVQCPLSGGLDSRLVLAALRAHGVQPHVYVYGPAGGKDVAIARAIGAAEGIPVAWIDKSRHAAGADAGDGDALAEQTARCFHEGDGLPNFGNIFDCGANAMARDLRHADGALAVSGGGGEVYRDFFFLVDRPMRADAVADAFFARFLRSDATEAFDPRAFLTAIRAKILDALDLPPGAGAIDRQRIEQIYPRVRCRALFGREASLESRYSPYLMPFLDHRVVAGAMTLPIAVKRAGAFEAALLAAIDPRLAGHMSAYGHDFAGPPSLRHCAGDWASRVRPPALRRHSYALQRRLHALGNEHVGDAATLRMRRVIDPDMPAMRRFFAIDRIADSGLMCRIANLEYLAGHLGSRLA